MTETTEEIIARLAKDRAKTILENGDFWGSPGAANTSATAITALVALVVPPVTLAKANAVAAAIEETKPARKNAKASANDTDAADA
jgi:hypothetical protein